MGELVPHYIGVGLNPYTIKEMLSQRWGIIVSIVCEELRVKPQDLSNDSRKRAVVKARHISMYFIRKKTRLNLTDIGRHFSRDHSSVIHAIETVDNHMDTNREYRKLIEIINKKISVNHEINDLNPPIRSALRV